jgi:colanic acid biosynthesis glycosyl transferase WcaI
MRILLLNQFFWPDAAATSQLLTDVARDLARQGHDVHAICAASSYASVSEEDPLPVTIYRVKASVFVRGRFGRILSYGSFYAGAAWRSLRIPKPDVVLTLTTPPLLSLIGNLLNELRGSKHWIWEMDLYPDVAVDLGYMKAGGFMDRAVGFLADWSRRRSNGVIALGECMKERLLARGIPSSHIEVCDNWADGSAIPVLEAAGSAGKLHILYSGNLGLAHDLDTLTGAIKELDSEERFRFLFVGSGGRRDELATFLQKESIGSVQMLPYVKRADLGSSLALGDIGLVTQRDACCGSVVPSKVYGLMAAGRPILFIGPRRATPARIIRQFGCGWHIACGDVAGLTALLLRLADCRDEVLQAGTRGRQALVEHFDLPLGTARISSILLRDSTFKPSGDQARSVAAAVGERKLISNS